MTNISASFKRFGRFSAVCRTLLFCLFAALLGMPAANAQYSPSASLDLGMGFGQMALSQSILSSATRNSRQKGTTGKKPSTHSKKAPAGSKKPAADPLAVRWDDAISRQFQKEVVDRISQQQNEIPREAIEKYLNSVNPPKTFRQLAYQYGLTPFSAPDLIATYSVVYWELIEGKKASKAKILQLRNTIRSNLENDYSMIITLRDADQKTRQYWFETQAYEIVLQRASYVTLQQTNQPAELKKFRNEISALAKKRGLMVDQWQLS